MRGPSWSCDQEHLNSPFSPTLVSPSKLSWICPVISKEMFENVNKKFIFNSLPVIVFCWESLQTVWTQIRPDRMSDPTWIQIVWHSDDNPERILLKMLNLKKSADNKSLKNSPSCKELSPLRWKVEMTLWCIASEEPHKYELSYMTFNEMISLRHCIKYCSQTLASSIIPFKIQKLNI